MVGKIKSRDNTNALFGDENLDDEKEEQGCYKDVVVIGNGPSGIILSYFLAGNWPYYNGLGENLNEMLHHRLSASGGGGGEVNNNSKPKAILEQDLNFLAQDLEGRSSNPVSLLFDTLNHPQADLGLELPSLLNWNFSAKNAVDHVVIGRGAPGGAWQSMDGSVLTISLGCWMELPEMNFREWEAKQESRCCRESRAPVSSVAQYYCDYVKNNKLGPYFLGNSVVTEVRRVRHQQNRLPEKANCDSYRASNGKGEYGNRLRRHTIGALPLDFANRDVPGRTPPPRSPPLWEVKGYSSGGNDLYVPFSYLTRNVVLAAGASVPNVLGVPGEHFPFVLHSLNHLEHLIVSGHLNQNSDPILVVGAGLSAADAIIAARFHSVPVIHIFRRSVEDPNLIFRQLPQNMYPEYHKVYQMMKDSTGYDGYKGLEQHVLVEVRPDQKVKIAGPVCCRVAKVSYILICIGSRPDLSFLGGLENRIGVLPGLPIDTRRNPVAIDVTSHESLRTPGLYALGPLIGENFVRFLQGGALAITSDINKKRHQEEEVLDNDMEN